MVNNRCTQCMRWTEYLVIYNPNTGSGNMESQSFEHGIAKNMSANTYTKSGNMFIGWAESAGGSVVYADCASFTTTGAVTLYAKWAPAYTVTFNKNTGLGTMEAQMIQQGATQNLNANSFTRVGHAFAGWATTAGGAVAYADGASYTTSSNASLYAKWTANTYTVRFDANTGSGNTNEQNFTYGIAQNLTTNGFSKTGNTFVGWATTAGGVAAYANGASYSAEDNITLYAKWTATYTIGYTLNGGTV